MPPEEDTSSGALADGMGNMYSAAQYDDWKINGHWHRCMCGEPWSDSDGGPCHEPCAGCGEPAEEEYCESCMKKLDADGISI